jgi:NADH-quinone oxidoreductase subunit J
MTQVIFWALSVVALGGALVVLLTHDVMRLALGLGAFLLAVAGYFALFGFGFLALAEIFVYVGGVLVILLFAIMLLHRSDSGGPVIESRHDPVAMIAAIGIGVLAAIMLRPAVPAGLPAFNQARAGLGQVLLGPMLPQFEMAGVLLLVALVAVVLVAGGDRE